MLAQSICIFNLIFKPYISERLVQLLDLSLSLKSGNLEPLVIFTHEMLEIKSEPV